jgi:hypothetical protein
LGVQLDGRIRSTQSDVVLQELARDAPAASRRGGGHSSDGRSRSVDIEHTDHPEQVAVVVRPGVQGALEQAPTVEFGYGQACFTSNTSVRRRSKA